jgi:tRNA1(Val) A37 N6-methylase TrmN6
VISGSLHILSLEDSLHKVSLDSLILGAMTTHLVRDGERQADLVSGAGSLSVTTAEGDGGSSPESESSSPEGVHGDD